MMKQFKTAILAGLGAGIEYYDFAIFALFAPLIGQAFFPDSHHLSPILLAFLVFALGYIVRPIGGLVFGWVGDKLGRKTSFFSSMLTLIISTFAMAILPGTETLGVSAAIIFVMLRCIQGMAIGGEIPTAITFCAEHFPNKQGFAVSIVFACLSIGILLTSLVYAGLSHIPQDSEFYQQSWRIAFLIGALLSCLTYLLRKKLYETRAFLTFKQNPSAEPAINNQYSRLRQSMAGILIIAAIAMLMTQLFLFLPSYLGEYVGVDKQTIGDLLLRGSLIMIVGCIVGGLLSDYLDKQLMFISLLVILGGFCIYFYQQASQGQLATSAFNMICFMFGMIPATYSVIIANSFAIDFRCRGVGLTYNLSYSIFSAPVPALSVYLLNRYDNLLTPVWLLMVSILISLVGIALIKRPSY